MGNASNDLKDSYFMNVKIIGFNMENFFKVIQESQKVIKELWNFEQLEQNQDVIEQIKKYFDKLQKNLDDENNIKQNIRETLIIKVNNIFDPEINLIIDLMNRLDEVQYMPLVLILYVEEGNQQIQINRDNYQQIDPRLIFTCRYSENLEKIQNEIDPILLRICSIHNDLGDRFVIENNKNKNINENDIDLIEKYFPFNINIACIGRFRQGKSTGVNEILQEYKAKESSNGTSQTKNLTFYQVKGKPIRVLDIPGFEDDKTVLEAVRKFKECGKKINRLKEKLHIILYFLNFAEVGTFMNLEYEMIKEMMEHKESKIIYVITHSNSNLNEDAKKRKIRNINKGLQNLLIKNNMKINERIKATEDNVIFVNFHKDYMNNIEAFGTKELFKKIYDFFIKSEDFINSFNFIEPDIIEENAAKLRKQGQDILLSNKISGGLVGLIPVVDLITQHFFIKKNAIKKVGELFGFDIDSIDQELEKENKDLLKDGLAKESIEKNVGNGIKVTSEAGGCIGGGISIGSGIAKAAEAAKMTADATRMTSEAANLGIEAAKLGTKALEYGTKAAKMGEEAAKLTQLAENMTVPWYLKIFDLGSDITAKAASMTTQATNMASESANLNLIASNLSTEAANMASKSTSLKTLATNMASNAVITGNQANSLRYLGVGFTVGSCIIGVGLGAYFTHKFCEELLDKFVEMYKKFPEKICNSYKEAAYYFLSYNK